MGSNLTPAATQAQSQVCTNVQEPGQYCTDGGHNMSKHRASSIGQMYRTHSNNLINTSLPPSPQAQYQTITSSNLLAHKINTIKQVQYVYKQMCKWGCIATSQNTMYSTQAPFHQTSHNKSEKPKSLIQPKRIRGKVHKS